MKRICTGILVIPLSLTSSWHIGSYSNIRPNKVTFENNSMIINIDKSASPLIYSFDKAKKISGFDVAGKFIGLPKLSNLSLQGEKGFDDYPLRMGIILKGDKKLSFMQKIVSPDWLKKLYSSIPANEGIDYVQFYNVTQNPAQLNTSRIHPLSSLLKENFFALVKNDGAFSYKVKFDESLNVSGVWISSDGDDTLSKYQVIINKLDLEN